MSSFMYLIKPIVYTGMLVRLVLIKIDLPPNKSVHISRSLVFSLFPPLTHLIQP